MLLLKKLGCSVTLPLSANRQEHRMTQATPQVLDLTFALGKNQKTDAPQWKSDGMIGLKSVIYVPDLHSAIQPSAEYKRFLCYRGRTVFESPSKTFVIVSVDLFEAITEEVKQVARAVETEVNLDEIEYDFELEVSRGVNTSTGARQWQSSVYEKELNFTTLYVVDRESPFVPSMGGEKFAAVEKMGLLNNDTFAIVLVSLVAKLDPEKLLVTKSEAIRKIASSVVSTSTTIGTISTNKHGRRPNKVRAQAKSLEHRTFVEEHNHIRTA